MGAWVSLRLSDCGTPPFKSWAQIDRERNAPSQFVGLFTGAAAQIAFRTAPGPFRRQMAQPRPQFGFRRPTGPVADHLAMGADDRTGPPLRQAQHDPQMRYALALGAGALPFF